MADQTEKRTPMEADTATEAAVLRQLLALYPAQPTFEDLLRQVAGGAEGFAERDAVERAVRDLTATGLLRQADDLVLPSLAALRFDELLGG